MWLNIYSIESSLKYLFNPIAAIFIQSKNGNIRLIHSWTFLFNPLKNTFNPPVIFQAFHLIFLGRARPKDQPTRRKGVTTHKYGGRWCFWFFQKQKLSYKELKSKTKYLKSSIKTHSHLSNKPSLSNKPLFLRWRHLFSRRVWFYFFCVTWIMGSIHGHLNLYG